MFGQILSLALLEGPELNMGSAKVPYGGIQQVTGPHIPYLLQS